MIADLPIVTFALARTLLGGAFLVFGIRNIWGIDGLTRALAARGMILPRLSAIIGVALQIVGGILVAIGPFALIGGVALIIFLIFATVLFHNFWSYSGADRTTHLNATIMNAGLAGAFLLTIATAL